MATFMNSLARSAPCLLTSLFIINVLLLINHKSQDFVYKKYETTDHPRNVVPEASLKDTRSSSKRSRQEKIYGEFILDTQGCRLKNYSPYDKSISSSIHRLSRPLKCDMVQTMLTYKQGNEIFINKSAIASYRNSFSHCTYKSIERNNTDDNSIRIGARIEFRMSILMLDEFAHVECFDGLFNIIYNEFYWIISKNKATEERKTLIENRRKVDKSTFNIMLIGIDSTSRLNKIRQMPKTSEYLKDELDAIEFNGYMKVGDNTFPNLVPLLSGNHEEEDPRCFSNRTDSFDNCPLMWQNFMNKGFVTLYGEDRPEWGSFNFERPGFDKRPTDSFLRPLMLAAFKAEKPMSQEEHCIGRRTENLMVLDYLQDFIKIFKDQAFFAFTFTSGLSHNSVNTLHTIDHEYLNLFKSLKSSGVLKNTIVFFLSDHGSRFGEIRNSKIGQHEDSTPFMSVVLPEKFKKDYSIASENLESNAERLVTVFDIHETLIDIIEDRIKIAEDTLEPDLHSERGISLFRLIPTERTCRMAGISPLYCVCEQYGYPISPADMQAKQAANALVAYLNNELAEKTTSCSVLKLSQIFEAEVIDSNDEEVENANLVRVKVEVQPSAAILEAVIWFRFDRSRTIRYKLKSGVNRLNRYGDQSWCVVDPILKKFCYCSQQPEYDDIFEDSFGGI